MKITRINRLKLHTMAKTFKIKDGKIIVNEEIQIEDYALLLKYDWHLYNLQKDIRNAKNDRFKNYLKKAKEIFAEEVLRSKPNKRVDLFGTHSVFYYLYGHTADWVKEAKNEAAFLKDLLVCISDNNVNRMVSIIRQATSQKEASESICNAYGIHPSSSERILSLPLKKILSAEPGQIEMQYEEAEALLQRITELEQAENEI